MTGPTESQLDKRALQLFYHNDVCLTSLSSYRDFKGGNDSVLDLVNKREIKITSRCGIHQVFICFTNLNCISCCLACQNFKICQPSHVR